MTGRAVAFLLISFFARLAVAGPPSGYSCGDGKVIKGQGCECPGGKAPGRDSENIAICVAKPRVEPDQPTAPTACMKDRKGRYQLKIDSTPQGAAVYIGDKSCGIVGYTPWTGLINAGPAIVLLEKDGYLGPTRTIDGKAKDVRFPLIKVAASIGVASNKDPNVEGAELSIDGLVMGKAPMVKIAMPGRHLVELKKAGFEPFSEWVEVKDGQRTTLSPMLKPLAPVVSKTTGILKVVSAVPGAEVFLDGNKVGGVPAELREVLPGEHFLAVRLEGYRPFEQKVRIEVGQTVTVTALLQAIAKYRFLVSPNGANILIDGFKVGVTPLTIDLEVGSHILRIEANGHEPQQEILEVEGGKPRTIDRTLSLRRPKK